MARRLSFLKFKLLLSYDSLLLFSSLHIREKSVNPTHPVCRGTKRVQKRQLGISRRWSGGVSSRDGNNWKGSSSSVVVALCRLRGHSSIRIDCVMYQRTLLRQQQQYNGSSWRRVVSMAFDICQKERFASSFCPIYFQQCQCRFVVKQTGIRINNKGEESGCAKKENKREHLQPFSPHPHPRMINQMKGNPVKCVVKAILGVSEGRAGKQERSGF